MARGLTTAVNNELATDKLNPVTLVYINVGTGFRFTDHYKDIVYDGNTYLASSLFLKVSEVTESSQVDVANITIDFSGADQTIISLFLSNSYMEKEAEVYKGFLDANQVVIADPFLLFKGRIESFNIDETETSSDAQIVVASHWSDFDKVEGRKTNTNSQQVHFAGDLGFEFASQTVQDIKWGRA
jgi:hypothetical protein